MDLFEQMDTYVAIKRYFKLNQAQILTLGNLQCADVILKAAWVGNWGAVELALTIFQILPNKTYGQVRD